MDYFPNEDMIDRVHDYELLAIESQAVDENLYNEIMDWESSETTLFAVEN